ncbi:MAG: leucyl aminopeptidase [Gammaproteobacteria bacterium]|nr:leucyl aminopeptidase [Gammaproteobacteria bacterium]
MEFIIKSGNPEKQRSACVVVGIHEPRKLSADAEQLDKATRKFITNILRKGDIEGKIGQTLMLHNVPKTLCERLLLVGCGKESELTDTKYRQILKSAIKTLNETGATEATSFLHNINFKDRDLAWKLRETVTCAHDTVYCFDQLKSIKEKIKRPLRKLALMVANKRDLAEGERAIIEGDAIAAGVKLAKDLGNLPGNICTPTYLADQAKALGKSCKNLTVKVLEEKDMKKLGMGSLLSVSRGSRQPAKLITLEYKGDKKNSKPIALVGKGLTFDAGGISLKPPAAMDEMKYDMCGGASVLGTIKAICKMRLPINVVGVIPSSENMPDGDANKPGDIVTSMSGQTIEILNTDAEGRLILCDALTYTERFKPDCVIDIATLTGACVIALGQHASGLMGNNQPLVDGILKAGKSAGDRAWEMPLWDEYQEQLNSNFADMANVGGREAGTITAGCFLSRYTKKFHWAHVDIAGTAWKSGNEKGSTGRPVPMLTQFIIDKCKNN